VRGGREGGREVYMAEKKEEGARKGGARGLHIIYIIVVVITKD